MHISLQLVVKLGWSWWTLHAVHICGFSFLLFLLEQVGTGLYVTCKYTNDFWNDLCNINIDFLVNEHFWTYMRYCISYWFEILTFVMAFRYCKHKTMSTTRIKNPFKFSLCGAASGWWAASVYKWIICICYNYGNHSLANVQAMCWNFDTALNFLEGMGSYQPAIVHILEFSLVYLLNSYII